MATNSVADKHRHPIEAVLTHDDGARAAVDGNFKPGLQGRHNRLVDPGRAPDIDRAVGHRHAERVLKPGLSRASAWLLGKRLQKVRRNPAAQTGSQEDVDPGESPGVDQVGRCDHFERFALLEHPEDVVADAWYLPYVDRAVDNPDPGSVLEADLRYVI